MSKFQVGDRVRVDDYYGGVYTVSSIDIQPVYTISGRNGEYLESNIILYSKLEPVFAIGDHVTDDSHHCGKVVAILEDFYTVGDYKYIVDIHDMCEPDKYIGFSANNLRKYNVRDDKTT